MSSSFSESLLERLHPRWPMLLYATLWTTILTATVAVASFSPELAFISAISSTSSLSQSRCEAGSVRLPLDIPSENFCFPTRLVKRAGTDMLVPPIFAAVIVAGSACVVKAMGLWEAEGDEF